MHDTGIDESYAGTIKMTAPVKPSEPGIQLIKCQLTPLSKAANRLQIGVMMYIFIVTGGSKKFASNS